MIKMETQTIQFQKQLTKKGYIRINIEGIWILEHKYIVERHIGRELTKDEVVHHINNIKTDNRISNLMLFKNQSEHRKFENKLKQFGWTKPIINQVIHRWDEHFI